MPIKIQTPAAQLLLAAINSAADGARGGGGVFAFATADGVNAFCELPNVAGMLRRGGRFQLIVGLDAITNGRALLAMSQRSKAHPSLITKAVLHSAGSLFHPKFCWFERGTELRLIVGSGNLTGRALGSKLPCNWEAFTLQTLTGATATAVLKEVADWIAGLDAAGNLLDVEDQRARNRAFENRKEQRTKQQSAGTRGTGPRTAPLPMAAEDEEPLDPRELLIREISDNRLGQVDIGKGPAESFFEYSGLNHTILLEHVSLGNVLGEVREDPIVKKGSVNYSIELTAVPAIPTGGLKAKNDDRMILVVGKFDSRSFRYTVVPVTMPAYKLVLSTLKGQAKGSGKGRRMRQRYITSKELKESWPDVPPALLPVAVP